jgi:hypothetical protein
MRYEAAPEVADRSIMNVRAQFEALSDSIEAALRELRESQARLTAHRIGERVQALAELGANWDGRGSEAANMDAIYSAIGALHGITQAVQEAGLSWLDPHIGLSENGQVVFEWWNRQKKLTIYVGREEIDYVSSWGPDMDEQMDAGPITGNFPRLWKWLTLAAQQ